MSTHSRPSHTEHAPEVLVTGATGTIGREVVRAMVARGLRVRIGVRDPSRPGPAQTTAVRLDWSDPGTFTAALAGVERVFLLTPFVEDPEPAARAFIDASIRSGVKFLVKLSAAGVSEDAPLEGMRQHARVEKAVAASGIPYAILRPTFFMDNVFTFQREPVLGLGAFHGASGRQPVAYVSSRDVGEVAALVLSEPKRHAGLTYELTGGAGVRDTEVAESLSKVLGRPIRYVDSTLEAYRAALAAQEAPAWVSEAMTGLEGIKRNGWAATVSPAIRELLGRAPESYEAFIARHAGLLVPPLTR